jgi:hypothetical protein
VIKTSVVESPAETVGVLVAEATTGDTNTYSTDVGELLEGWVQLVDASSGKQYYFNEAEGTTTWDRPVGADLTAQTEHDSSNDTAIPLPQGWITVEDVDTGGIYYVNKIENKTTWDRPVLIGASSIARRTTTVGGGRNRSAHAFASFGFGGTLCVFRVSPSSRTLEMHKVCDLVASHPVVLAEKYKRGLGIVGALNNSDSGLVSSYVAAKAKESNPDLLWNLIQIASQAEGRLRSDEGVADTSSPESSVIQLLLQSETSSNTVDNRYDEAEAIDSRSNRACLDSIESLLLHGKREEAVEEAVASRQFAMALLIASMCDRVTFQYVTKKFAMEIASNGAPLHTIALLFSGQLEPPPDSALDRAGLLPTVWSDATDKLRQTWRQHLCAIISNRILGWDRIVLSLGDHFT